jgi:hypothetical protein
MIKNSHIKLKKKIRMKQSHIKAKINIRMILYLIKAEIKIRMKHIKAKTNNIITISNNIKTKINIRNIRMILYLI